MDIPRGKRGSNYEESENLKVERLPEPFFRLILDLKLSSENIELSRDISVQTVVV